MNRIGHLHTGNVVGQSKYSEPVVAVEQMAGAVKVINPESGVPEIYAVRGLKKYSKEHPAELQILIQQGFVHAGAVGMQELPNIWDVAWERPELMDDKLVTKMAQIVTKAKKARILR